MKIVKEHFGSIHQMLSVIESRPNNSVMAGQDSSKTGTKRFTGTDSYEEAKQLFETGYTEILDQVKTGVGNNLKKTQNINRRTIRTGVIGYAPHVPNAILGLPNSMILTEQQPQKIKTVSIVVGITEKCGTKAEEFVKSGIAALSVVNTLELRGYRVALKVAFWCSEGGNERAWGTITLKDYREHMDIQKLCFPLAHPSMFRRFGFKWLETCPEIKDFGWAWGYGRQLNDSDFIKKNFLGDNEFFINLSVTKECDYDPDKIIEKMNLK
jgi:hypothetical protein